MNPKRGGAPDMALGYECGQCESFCFIGDGGCGYCQRKYDQWREVNKDPSAADVLNWMQLYGSVYESDDACPAFVEYE